ncbi:phBC6A51 family helix-turn-helix protein [Clostridium butyricum]|uniref:phBC6A51 family helix-turn-helix protein n=1 Tax=Clostridium butyricum TaxID=1492 RepID=UPI00374F0D8A
MVENFTKQGLTATQKKACELLVMKDINRMNNDDIAKECGVDRSTFYRWKQKKEFNDYLNSLADEFQRSFLSDAFAELRKLMTYGKPHEKLKAIELIMKNQGRLKDTTDLNANVKAEVDVDAFLQQLGL